MAAPRRPAPPRRLGVLWPSRPGARGAGAPPPPGWPFGRGTAIWPHSSRRARVRVPGSLGRRRKGWSVAASLRARQRRARWPSRRAGPFLQPQSLGPAGSGWRRGCAGDPEARVALLLLLLCSPGPSFFDRNRGVGSSFPLQLVLSLKESALGGEYI